MAGTLKVAVRKAIAACGGIERGAAIAGRQPSTAGLWNNLNLRDLPPLDCALALDEAAVAHGGAAHITRALAFELGQVLVELPQGRISSAHWNRVIADLSTEHADLLAGLLRDLADQNMKPREAEARRRDAQALLAVIVEIDQRLRAIAEGGE